MFVSLKPHRRHAWTEWTDTTILMPDGKDIPWKYHQCETCGEFDWEELTN